jgi:hypothetical protein
MRERCLARPVRDLHKVVIDFGLDSMGEMGLTFDHNPPLLGSVVAR